MRRRMESRCTISSTIRDYVGLHVMNSNSWYNDFFFPRDAMLSVCDALQVSLPVPCSHRLDLEFFENNFTTK